MSEKLPAKGEFLVYRTDNGQIKLEVGAWKMKHFG